MEDINNKYNFKILNSIAKFLNSNFEKTVTEDVLAIMQSGVNCEDAVRFLIGEGGQLDTFGNDRADFSRFYPEAIKKANPEEFAHDSYYKTVLFKEQKRKNVELCYEKYRPFEPFVIDDLTCTFDGMILPQIGFFDKEFLFPAVKENGRIWMTVTPNEINTMRRPIENAHGKVLTLGLGLGYFAFSCAIKYDVTSVTIVEKNPEIIQLFNDCILPYFPNPDKILIKQGDAIEFMSNPDTTDFNLIFCDLWHDVSDGIPLWEELKKCEKNFKNSKFYYWIEQSMKYYI